METTKLSQDSASGLNTSGRRELLRAAAAMGATALVGGVAALSGTAAYAAVDPPLRFKDIRQPRILNLPGLQAGNDIRTLNYALTLEDLESDCYLQAVMRLTTGGTNMLGTQIPGLNLSYDEPDVFFINQFAAVEAEHRDYLRSSLDGLIKGLATPSYKYAFGIESMDRAGVLELIRTVEATGTSAYLGAVPTLKTREFITAAAAIQGTEARHTAVITAVQNVLFPGAAPKPVAPLATDNNGIDTPLDPDTVLAQVSPYIVR